MRTAFIGVLTGAVVITWVALGGIACSSTSSGGGGGGSSGSGGSGGSSGGASSSSSSGGEDGSGGSGSGSGSSSGGGGCTTKVYSHESQSNDCIESYAPQPPSGFTSGQCPTAGLNGCCVKDGPCGFTATCYYNLPSQLVSGAMNNCATMGGMWNTTVP